MKGAAPFVIRMACCVAMGSLVRPMLEGNSYATIGVIMSCLMYLHCAMFEVVDSVLNGNE